MLDALKPDDYLPLVKAALAEDIGSGDATSSDPKTIKMEQKELHTSKGR